MSAQFSPLRGIPLHVLFPAVPPGTGDGDAAPSPVEYMVMEHGLAERIMLIYERSVKDWKAGEEVDLSLIHRAARIAGACIAECHERNEERYLFPLFREEGYLTDTVDALVRQHEAGREVTGKIIDLSTPGRIRDATHMNVLMTLCRSYNFMCRPHISRENTGLFPRLRGIAGDALGDIGERMATSVRAALGEEGYGSVLRDLAEIEQSLGIHDLAGYTIGYG